MDSYNNFLIKLQLIEVLFIASGRFLHMSIQLPVNTIFSPTCLNFVTISTLQAPGQETKKCSYLRSGWVQSTSARMSNFLSSSPLSLFRNSFL
ncbi:unnamed protein product [Nezara viridula]|uniref:Uncharacterized protein n=1 Tax=Nezara viridula TaxID=85310 RepID=A0A9P0HTX9_NEZVI|nr:unnamed protein product [Nezara viridula]